MSHKFVIGPRFSVEFTLVMDQDSHGLTAYCQLSVDMIDCIVLFERTTQMDHVVHLFIMII
jgi:hypothetical protein